MVFPNSACALFCYWMLYVSAQKLTSSQRLLTEAIYTAAQSASAVTSQEWYNFNLFAAWRNKYFIVWRDYAQQASPLAAAWYSYLAVQPSASYKTAVEALIQSMLNSGAWGQHDRIWIKATEQEQQATISLINPSSTAATFNGSYTWSANDGVTGDSNTSYVDTNFNLFTQGVQYRLQNACYWFYVKNVTTATTAIAGAANLGIGTYCIQQAPAGLTSRINNVDSNDGTTVVADGLYVIRALPGGGADVWYNGVRLSTAAGVAAGIPNSTFFELAAILNGALFLPMSGTMCMSGYGSGEVDPIALFESIEAFRSSIGF